MAIEPKEFELVWLRELERRAAAGEPVDVNGMMVALRDQLPRGFRPADVDSRLLYGQGLSALGLRSIGDSAKLLPDLQRVIIYIRGLLLSNPTLNEVSATAISEALKITSPRTEVLLQLLSSLGNFLSYGSGSSLGFTNIGFSGQDILAEYLGFKSVDDALSRRQDGLTGTVAPTNVLTISKVSGRALDRNSVFILMSMDPKDAGLTDVCNAIKAVCEQFGLHADRIDDIEHQERITDRILESIQSAEFIIADLSGERPNVYYEVGYAHALGKHPILVRKNETHLHFDLSVHNVPEYRNITELTALLRKRLEAILGRPARGVRS